MRIHSGDGRLGIGRRTVVDGDRSATRPGGWRVERRTRLAATARDGQSSKSETGEERDEPNHPEFNLERVEEARMLVTQARTGVEPGRSPGMRTAAELPARSSCDVAIVGYGPVAMTLAAMLAGSGLSVMIVERWPERYKLPRAGHFDGETLRTFQRMGIANEVEVLARPVIQWDLVTADKEVLASIKLGEANAGWKESYILPQPEFEEILQPRLNDLGIGIYMGTTATGVDQDAERVRLTVKATEVPDAEARVIDAAFVIGADGANSFVRGAIGSDRHDLGFEAHDELVIDFEHNDPDVDLPGLPEILQVMDVKRPRLAGRWSGSKSSRFEFQGVGSEDRAYLERDDTAWKLLAEWGLSPGSGRIVRQAVYRFESKLADKWRDGRVLLVGDAAHTMPPFMGQGLCSGIRDCFNLTWKLLAVHAGQADQELLDTYQSERLPHSRAIIEISSAVGSAVLLTDPEKARERDEAFRAGQVPRPPTFPRLGPGIVRRPDSPDAHPTDGRPSIQGRVALGKRIDRLDDLLGPGWRIISRHPVPGTLFNGRQSRLLSSLAVEFAHVSRGAGAQYADVDGDYDLWYRQTGRKCFLLRPDHYVFGSASTVQDLPGLIDELADVLSANGWRTDPPRSDKSNLIQAEQDPEWVS